MPRKPTVSVSDIEREIVLREGEEMAASFRKFVEGAWHIVEPGARFITGMHIEAICEHLQATESRQIRRLLVNVQPRSGKSTLISVLYPAWLWTRHPEERILSASYGDKLAMKDSVNARRVIESDWYRARWPHVRMVADQNRQSIYENTRLGRRQTTSVGAGGQGLGGNTLILDDPLSQKDADSKILRENANEWYAQTWATRKNPNPEREPCLILVMQRLHEMDLSGYLLETEGRTSEGGLWDHLVLPTEYEAGPKHYTSIGWCDPRTDHGELLWPVIQGTDQGRRDLAAFKKTLGSYGTAGQLQQRPVPKGGGIIQQHWLRFWYDEDLGRPEPHVVAMADGSKWECPQKPLPKLALDAMTHSWDLAFKDEKQSDYVVGQVWALGEDEPANRYLLHQERDRMDFPATAAAVVRVRARYAAHQILIEAKANGSGIIQTLQSQIPGILPVDPGGNNKESKCHAVSPYFEAGNVWLPHPKQFEWVEAYIHEITTFPRGRNDDQVDATTQALLRMADSAFLEMDLSPIIRGAEPNPFIC